MSLPRGMLMVAIMSLLLGACSAPSPSTTPLPYGSGSSATTEAPTDVGDRRSPGASAASAASGRTEPGELGIEPVASGLDSPVNITATPDGWLLVNERGGRIMGVDAESGEVVVAADLTDRVRGEGERGLLGLALHPDWPQSGRAFVHYTDRNGDTVLSELAAAPGEGDAPALDPASERILLQLPQPFSNHNGGQLAFGPDGYLYLGLGDGGSAGDPHGNGQNARTLLGAILRLDVAAPGAYRIPGDNPFVDGTNGAPEVFLYGLRNPWRFSFDRSTGQLWIADVGQNAYEEIDRVDPLADAGANLGWAVMEASHCFADPGCSSDGMVAPVAEYARDLGCSVTGGYVYRGEAIDGLAGWYLFSDSCTGLLFAVPADVDPTAAPRVLLETGVNVSTFGEGPDGTLYLADLSGGTIYRIVGGD